jgi:hypothetical protein
MMSAPLIAVGPPQVELSELTRVCLAGWQLNPLGTKSNVLAWPHQASYAIRGRVNRTIFII